MRFVVFIFPWLELFTLIELGVRTSALTALAYAIGTGLIGMAILQRQGLGIFERLRQSQHGGIISSAMLFDDMAMGFAGFLLLVPGMLTDVCAILIMIRPLRRRLARALSLAEPTLYVPERDGGSHQTFEGEFRYVDSEKDRNSL